MKLRNRLPEPRVVQSVIEWRFPRAHRYWDDCGKLIQAIETAFPGLVCQGLQSDGFGFEAASGAITGAKFYWDQAVVNQVERGDAGLADAASRFWKLVTEGLSAGPATRLGHRSWLVFETESVEMASRWLDGFAVWGFAAGGEVLGQPLAAGCVLRARIEPGGRTARFEVNAGSWAMKNTAREYRGVVVDTDIVLEGESAAAADMTQFIQDNRRFLRETVQSFFRSK